MSKRTLVYWIVALPLIAICLHPLSVEAKEKPRWQFVGVLKGMGHSTAIAKDEAECDSMMVAFGKIAEALQVPGLAMCNELHPVESIPEGFQVPPKSKMPTLKKERDS